METIMEVAKNIFIQGEKYNSERNEFLYYKNTLFFVPHGELERSRFIRVLHLATLLCTFVASILIYKAPKSVFRMRSNRRALSLIYLN